MEYRGPGAMQSDDNGRVVYRVADLTRLIKSTLEEGIGPVWVEGEVSNLSQPASGHMYFTIKDEESQLRAVLWRGNQRFVKVAPKDGLLVRVFGEITVFERGGYYQLVVRALEPGGIGALQAAFEALKKKLQAEGLFDPGRKRLLPMLPQHVGVVTSPTGAAIRDILKVISRRFPNMHVVIAPVRVQGAGAAEEIAAAIDMLNARGALDVLIVGRGGGSLEDLWSFNEETVARAIARSRIPVISAVGHEIDFTISDFVADVRAATPSAAAEMLVESRSAFEQRLDALARRLAQGLQESLLVARNRFTAASASYVFREPAFAVRQYRQRVENLQTRQRHALAGRVREVQQRVDELGLRLPVRIQNRTAVAAEHLRRFEAQLRALNPLAILGRGYSVTMAENGRIVRAAGDVKVGERLTTRLHQGTLASEVIEKHDQEETK